MRALSDPEAWDAGTAPHASRAVSSLAPFLFRQELMAPIEMLFQKWDFRTAGVTVGKVLVGGFRGVPFYQGDMPSGWVPFDAQVWFRLE